MVPRGHPGGTVVVFHGVARVPDFRQVTAHEGMVGAVDADGYVTFLIIGVLLVGLDGMIVYRSGRAYLDEAYRDARASKSMAQLVTVLFHLVVLGVLALISIIDVNTGSQVQDVVVKLGVVLLVLAAAHAATMAILSRLRDRLRDEQITDELMEQKTGPGHAAVWNGNGSPNPVGEEYHNRHPAVSPPIEEQQQFPASG
jgi:hypothetical protein